MKTKIIETISHVLIIIILIIGLYIFYPDAKFEVEYFQQGKYIEIYKVISIARDEEKLGNIVTLVNKNNDTLLIRNVESKNKGRYQINQEKEVRVLISTGETRMGSAYMIVFVYLILGTLLFLGVRQFFAPLFR